MDVRLQKKGAMVACGAAALALGLSGCSGAGFDGSGSKEAASAEQLAMRADDPWAVEVTADPAAKAAEPLRDGVYTGTGKGMNRYTYTRCSSKTTTSPASRPRKKAKARASVATRPCATACMRT